MGAVLPAVKNSNKLKITHKDALGTTNSETFNFALNIADCTNTVTANALYQWGINFCALSADTYDDIKITSTRCVESLAGGDNDGN